MKKTTLVKVKYVFPGTIVKCFGEKLRVLKHEDKFSYLENKRFLLSVPKDTYVEIKVIRLK